jgi:hypothetical protein
VGKLLQFERAMRPDTENTDSRREAELVMFTGIRYERQEKDAEKAPGTAPQRESGS